MTRDQIDSAMTVGRVREYGDSALGHFGLGLKAASFSQADSLTVMSVADGSATVGRRWLESTYLDEITGSQVNDWLLIAPQVGKLTVNLPDIGQRRYIRRVRRRHPLFGAISDPKHRAAALRIADAAPGWSGDDAIDAYRAPHRGAVLLYIVQDERAAEDDPMVAAFTLVAPADASTRTGKQRAVQFRAKVRRRPTSPIVNDPAAGTTS